MLLNEAIREVFRPPFETFGMEEVSFTEKKLTLEQYPCFNLLTGLWLTFEAREAFENGEEFSIEKGILASFV